jgi:uncharacterized protein YuzE
MSDVTNERSIDYINYNLVDDDLFLYHNNIKYESSVDLGNVILDLDAEGSPIGLEILDASKLFKVPKSSLQNIQTVKAEISISSEIIEIKIMISVLFPVKYPASLLRG